MLDPANPLWRIPQMLQAIKEAGARADFLVKKFLPGLAAGEMKNTSRVVANQLQANDHIGLAQTLKTPHSVLPGLSGVAGTYLSGTAKPSELLQTLTNRAYGASWPAVGGQTNLRGADLANADATAMSGRHLNLPSNQNAQPELVLDGHPTTAYKGFSDHNWLTPNKSIRPGEPVWWSGLPEVAANYGGHYIAEAPVSQLKSFGPHEGSFHPHQPWANDSRGITQATPSDEWLQDRRNSSTLTPSQRLNYEPNYEAQFTAPAVPFSQYASALYKKLPSGNGFQQVLSKPVPALAKLAGAPVKDPTLAKLLQAKAESDRKNYPAKAALLRQLIEAHPENFLVDSTNNGVVGLTHTPTSFKIHLLQKQLPQALLQAAGELHG